MKTQRWAAIVAAWVKRDLGDASTYGGELAVKNGLVKRGKTPWQSISRHIQSFTRGYATQRGKGGNGPWFELRHGQLIPLYPSLDEILRLAGEL